jgi:hypothetical protein
VREAVLVGLEPVTHYPHKMQNSIQQRKRSAMLDYDLLEMKEVKE